MTPEMQRAFDRIQAAAERIRDLQTPEYREETMEDLVARAEKIWTAKERRLHDVTWLCESFAEFPPEQIKIIGGRLGRETDAEIGAMVRILFDQLAEKAATKEVDE